MAVCRVWDSASGLGTRNLNRSKVLIRRTDTDFSFLGEAKQTHTEEVCGYYKKKAGTIGVLETHELS